MGMWSESFPMAAGTTGHYTGWKLRRHYGTAGKAPDVSAALPGNSATLSRDDSSAAKNFWDSKASAKFQHLDREYVEARMSGWQKFLKKFDWSGKKVLDYGIGGGYLGETLFKNHSIGAYVGVDISQNSIDTATKVLEPWAQ